MSSVPLAPAQADHTDSFADTVRPTPFQDPSNDASTSYAHDSGRSDSSQHTRSSGSHPSAVSEHHRPLSSADKVNTPPPTRFNQPDDKEEITITIGLLCDHKHHGAPSQPRDASFQTTAKPEEIRRLLGIPEFQPRDSQPTCAGQRNYNYEEKYPPDKPGDENEPDARFFKVYLDEAEIFDHEKIRSYRDNLDTLLILAALLSAVVTTFVAQTTQTLRPDQGLINNYLLLYQIEILKVMGNRTAVASIASPQYFPDTVAHSHTEVWINGLFITSLSLSISTALLSVLAKQRLRAYDSSTFGSARDRALVRHLRFRGLIKWKLDEIIGVLPIVLHLSVAIFLIGLTLFLWVICLSLAYIVIVISGISFALYLASIILPAIDLECPYRIPILYRPMSYLVILLSDCLFKFKGVKNRLLLKRKPIGPIPVPQSSRNPMAQLFWPLLVTTSSIRRLSRFIWRSLQKYSTLAMPTLSLNEAERSAVHHSVIASRSYLHYSIAWLHDMSSNMSVQRVATQALGGNWCDPWGQSSNIPSFHVLYTTPLIHTATEGLFDGEDIPPNASNIMNPSPWVRAVENLHWFLSRARNSPSIKENIVVGITRAAGMGRANHVQYILRQGNGVDVNSKRPTTHGRYLSRETPLYAASFYGHPSIFRLLLDQDVDVNAIGGTYGSALHVASACRHTNIARLLLEKGADVNLKDESRGSALHVAAGRDYLDIVKLLLHHGSDVNIEGGEYGSALHIAAASGRVKIVGFLLKRGANVNIGGPHGSPLHVASARNRVDIVKILLENGADVNTGGKEHGSALHKASIWGHLEVVTLLLEKEADVNLTASYYGSPLQAAASGGHIGVVKLLLEVGAHVNLEGGQLGSAPQASSTGGHLEVVKVLLEKGADVNLKGGMHGSSLQAAASGGHLEIVKLLLDKEADVTLGGGLDGSAFQAAARKGRTEIADLLRSYGAV